MRIWFPNAPSGSVNASQRERLGVGYYIQTIVVEYLNYLRRYLNDNDTLDTVFTTYAVKLSPTSSYLTYLRSYLGDQ